MTHGSENTLMAFDGDYNEQELLKNFTKDNCPSLKGKPKLLFIQACRGEKHEEVNSSESSNIETTKIESDAKALSKPITREVTNADTLTMYSSQQGFASFRDPKEGSWFIQALTEEMKILKDDSGGKDLVQVLTNVNRKVKVKSIDTQMPVITSSLTKTFVIMKKNYVDLVKNYNT